MNIKFYPNLHGIDDVTGSLYKFFEKLAKKRPDLWTMVKTYIKKAEESSDLSFLERQGIVKKLRDSSLYEFRIPPHKKPGGTIRLYFGYKKNDKNTIIILHGELKKINESNSEIIAKAEQYYKEVCLCQ